MYNGLYDMRTMMNNVCVFTGAVVCEVWAFVSDADKQHTMNDRSNGANADATVRMAGWIAECDEYVLNDRWIIRSIAGDAIVCAYHEIEIGDNRIQFHSYEQSADWKTQTISNSTQNNYIKHDQDRRF